MTDPLAEARARLEAKLSRFGDRVHSAAYVQASVSDLRLLLSHSAEQGKVAEELREALRPFAKAGELFGGVHPRREVIIRTGLIGDSPIEAFGTEHKGSAVFCWSIKPADFVRAARAIASAQEGERRE